MTTGIVGTKPELAVYKVLTDMGVSFEFQSKMMGGRDVKGGAIADFFIYDLNLIIRVQGEYFHSQTVTKARDTIQKLALENSGYRVIDLMAEDVLRNARFYVQEALRGISHAHEL